METPKNNALDPAATEPSANQQEDISTTILPQDVRRLNRWLVFKLTPRADGTMDKVPLSVHGGFAKSDDPATWGTFEDARAYCATNDDCVLGFALGEDVGLVVIDIDKARKSRDESWPEWVEQEVAQLDSFTEESCSGLGQHVWVWGRIPSNLNRQKLHVELHGSKKMFAVSEAFAEWRKIRVVDPGELEALHARVDKGDIGPNHRPAIRAYAYDDCKFRDLCAGDWEKYFPSRSEAVGPVLCTLAKQHHGDAEAIREEFEATKLCEIWAEKWPRLGDREIQRAIDRSASRKTKSPECLEFRLPAMPKGPKREYVLKPVKRFSGWFPRGAVSVIGGASNAGKTSLILELLVAQRRGGQFLGREGSGLSFLWLSADRGEEDNLETLERLDLLDEHDDPLIPLDYMYAGAQGFTAAEQILRKIEEHKVPAVVFVEGADGLVEDPNKTQIVAPFLSLLRQIAERYRVAIILSVGAPKAKPGEVHMLKRDRIFGSQIWTRMTSTVLVLSYVGDGTESARDLDVSYKNAAPESFPLEINPAGRFVPRIDAPDVDALELWARDRQWFTRAQAVAAMAPKGADAGMSRASVYGKIKKMLAAGKLEKRFPAGKEELRFKQPEQAEDPFAEVAEV